MTPRESLRSRKRARARDELVQTALALFERQGFAGTTVEQICDHAEYSQSTFFRYFGSKEDVLFADVDDFLSRLESNLSTHLATTSTWDAVRASVEATTAEFVMADPEFGARRIDLWMSEPQLRARYVEHAAAWEATIAAAVAHHRNQPRDDVLASIVGMSAISAFRIAVESIPTNGGDFNDRLHRAFDILGHGLADV